MGMMRMGMAKDGAQLALDLRPPVPAGRSAAPRNVAQVPATETRRHRGAMNHAAGLAAEAQVAELYRRQGQAARARRWRGPSGEIDLILGDGPVTVFVEVKRARTLDEAAWRLQPRQVRRLEAAAAEYMADQGTPLGEMRFDLALVDRQGRVRIMENAIGYW